jgi:hypothetical protein
MIRSLEDSSGLTYSRLSHAPGRLRWTGTDNVSGVGSVVLTMSALPNIGESPYFSPSELIGSPGQAALRLIRERADSLPENERRSLQMHT